MKRAPQSRRERPAKPALSRERIVAAAIRLIEADDADRLTIRRLAAELDTGSASLYVYVRNTTELYALMLDEKLGTLDLAWNPKRTPWLPRLVTLLTAYTELLMQYSSLARSAMLTRPTGENYLALVETILRLLTSGGVPPERAAWGVDVLLQTATAGAVEFGARARSEDDDDLKALTQAIQDAPRDRYPLIASLGLELLSGPGPARGAWAFEVLANGVLATPRPTEHP